MQKHFIKEINEEFYNLNKDKYNNFIHCGFFNNNHVMIVGICPGNPYNLEQKQLVDDLNNDIDYKSREKKYYNIIKNTKISEYINKIFGDNWSHLSFTNLVKCPAQDNEEPSVELVRDFKPLLEKQIKIVNPNLVVLLGKFVGKQFGIENFYEFKKIDDIYYTVIPHPSYWNYNNKDINLIKEIKTKLNSFFKYHALVNVNNYSVYYRDEEFKKCKYDNIEKDDFYFTKSDISTNYKSYDGFYLKKCFKSEVLSSEDTYEYHLKKKDLFYYNNLNKISHSKIIRYMSFDLENDYCNDAIKASKPITSIAWFDSLENKKYCLVFKNNINQQITVKDKEDLKIEVFEDEKKMLEKFFSYAREYDCLAGWYSSKFDVPYLFNRASLLNINLEKYFDNLWIPDKADIFFMCDSHIFFDCLLAYQKTIYFNKPPSYSLDAVSKFLFGDLLGGKAKHLPLDVIWKEDINNLIIYNIRDVELLEMIIEHSKLIEYPLLLQQFCPQDFENVFYNSKTIENLLHHEYWNKNVYFPTKKNNIKRDFEGAVVLKPDYGLHENVVFFDFSGMYTNIIISENLSPDTLVGEKKYVENNLEEIKKELINRYSLTDEIKDDFLEQCLLIKNDFGEYYFLPKNFKVGVLPLLEMKFLNLRKQYTDLRDSFDPESKEYKMADDVQGLAKTLLNSCYGITGYEKFILFNPIISSSITSIGRQLIYWVKQEAENKKYTSIMGDTDSTVFLLDKNLDINKCIEKSKELSMHLNNSFKEFAKKFTSNEFVISECSHKTEFEKIYSKFILGFIHRNLASSQTVKKRYFGYLKYYKGKILETPKLQVVGFETRKESTPVYFKDVLLNIYKMFLEDNYKDKIIDYYNFIKKDIKKQPIENLLIRMKLSRDLDKYKKTTPIHVRAARNSKANIKRADYVNIVFVKDSREVIHYDEMNIDKNIRVDYDKYIEKMFIDKIKLIDDTIVLDDNKKLNEFFILK